MLTLNEKVAITPLGLQFRTDLTFEEWSALAGEIGGALRSMAFVLGDWLVSGEDHFEKQLLLPGFEASACAIANHIPFINRLCAWWNHVGGRDWLKTRTPEQIAAILRDFQPVTDLIASLQTASAISSKGRHQNQTDLPL